MAVRSLRDDGEQHAGGGTLGGGGRPAANGTGRSSVIPTGELDAAAANRSNWVSSQVVAVGEGGGELDVADVWARLMRWRRRIKAAGGARRSLRWESVGASVVRPPSGQEPPQGSSISALAAAWELAVPLRSFRKEEQLEARRGGRERGDRVEENWVETGCKTHPLHTQFRRPPRGQRFNPTNCVAILGRLQERLTYAARLQERLGWQVRWARDINTRAAASSIYPAAT
uniref:Uncharacterized protein n=1 Tax=Setaria viridis TaxID=4556 RepID=A0A4V6DCM2_SETVI|nr:hypothetical protein SEVIR_1G107750v2 [Setaria viridis]